MLRPRLAAALAQLNPDLPLEALALAVEELCRDRGALSPVEANREIYGLLRDGVKVRWHTDDGDETVETVRVIDWDHPVRNDFFLASQFWITGEIYKRRADLVGFANGLPLVFAELKASHRRLEHAYRDNLRDYKTAIPQLFPYNAFIILSNGSASKIGTLSSRWEHFNDCKKINSEYDLFALNMRNALPSAAFIGFTGTPLMAGEERTRAVFGDKVNGLIVDYIGVFRNLQRALAIYSSAAGGGIEPGDLPVQAKAALVAQLGQAIAAATSHCIGMGADLAAIPAAPDEFRRIARPGDAVEALIANDAAKLRYLSLAGDVARLYRAILPDPAANQYNAQRALFAVLAEKIRALAPVPDISGVMGEVNDLLDESIKPDGYVIRAAAAPVREAGAGLPDHVLDLSKLDLDALQRRFAQGRKHIEAEKLRGALNARLARMVRLNRSAWTICGSSRP